MQDLSSLTRIEPVRPAVEAWSLNHWTAREVPRHSKLVGRRRVAGTGPSEKTAGSTGGGARKTEKQALLPHHATHPSEDTHSCITKNGRTLGILSSRYGKTENAIYSFQKQPRD